MLISIGEYAEKNGVAHETVKKGCQVGRFKTAQKIGRNWAIDSEEPYIDNRIKTGKFVGKRNNKVR